MMSRSYCAAQQYATQATAAVGVSKWKPMSCPVGVHQFRPFILVNLPDNHKSEGETIPMASRMVNKISLEFDKNLTNPTPFDR